MLLLRYTQQRLRSLIAEVDQSLNLEFPYPDSEEALHSLKGIFEEHLHALGALTPKNQGDVVAQSCQLALRAICDYLFFVGFIVRSTAIRNAFEAFGPLLRLAGGVLEPGKPPKEQRTKLVLSSEWDYSPYTFPVVKRLSDYIFIGLPAPESSNPLLLPLSGHEIGHAVWHRGTVRQQCMAEARSAVIQALQNNLVEYRKLFPALAAVPDDQLGQDFRAIESWQPALQWCLHQAEETFCDFVGLGIFGESFFHAFAYLLAPGYGSRAPVYPDIAVRVQRQAASAAAFGITFPPSLSGIFKPDTFQSGPNETFLVKIADEAVEMLSSDLLARAKLAACAAPARASDEEIQRIKACIGEMVPAENCESIADIINAAWLAYHDEKLWDGYGVPADRKHDVLRDVVLKNLEIFEIEQIQGAA